VTLLDAGPAGRQMTERQPGEFARHPHTGAPYVAHPTETTKRTGTKAELFAELEAAGINWQSDLDIDPSRTPTIAQMQDLLGPRPKRVQYGRPSSLGNQIENMTNIQKWCERAVALGCFLRPELLEPLGDVDPAALNLDDGETRDLLDTIAVKGKDAARAGLSADRGTHGHELTEDSDNDRDWIVRAERGEHLGLPMEVQTALVAAWQRMLDVYGIEILAVESTCVDDQWRQRRTLAGLRRAGRVVRPVGAVRPGHRHPRRMAVADRPVVRHHRPPRHPRRTRRHGGVSPVPRRPPRWP
jgi:hypothetical protein